MSSTLPRSTVSAWVAIGAMLLVFWALVAIASSASGSVDREILMALLAIAAASFAPMLLLGVSRVSPGFLYALATFLLIGIGSLAWLGTPAFAAPGLGQPAIVGALLTLALGVVAFWAGYLLVRPPRDVVPETPARIVPASVLFVLLALGIVATAILMTTGRFGYEAIFSGPGDISWWQQWVQTASGLTGIAVVLAAVHAFGNGSRAHRRALLLILVASLAIGFLTGYKSAVLAPLATTLFVYYFYRRRLPWGLLLAAVVLFMIVVPANLTYRVAIVAGTRPPTTVFDTVLEMSIQERITVTAEWVSVRLRNIDSIGQIQRLTPAPHPYIGASEFVQIPAITLIPRVLWPSKPTENVAITFGRTYFGAPADSVNSYAITNVGDLFMHAGLTAVIVGMIVWGAFGGALFRWLWRRQSPAALLVYVTVVFRMVQVETTFESVISEGFRAVMFAWLVGRLLYGPMPRFHPASSDAHRGKQVDPGQGVR